MKGLRIFLFAILPSLLWGCVKEVEQQLQDQESLHEVVFHAGWAPETKTVLQEDGSVWWSPGDEISLFVGDGENGGYKLTATNTTPEATVDFVGWIGDGSNNAKYIAIYPYNEKNRIEGDDIIVTIPSVQVAKEGTFAESALVSVAISDNESLYFTNICGGIKFSVANEGITKVVFRDHIIDAIYANNSPLSGNVKLNRNVTDGYCEPLYDGSESMSITVLPSDGECFEPGKFYYVTMIPKAFNDLEVQYYKEDLVASYRLTYLVTQETHQMPSIQRSVFKRVYEKDSGLVFSKAYNTYAVFKTDRILPDDVDKALITEAVFHTSTNKTTNMLLVPSSESEATASIYFELDGTVAHYYTSAERYQIREAGWLFGGWSSLKRLDLSMFSTESITNMSYMFADCINLEYLDVSSFNTGNVDTMTGMFQNCRHLKTLNISNFSFNRLSDAGYMFFRCLSLTNLDLGTFEMPKTHESASWYSMDGVAQLSKNCGIRCSARTRDILCEPGTGIQEYSKYITWFLPDNDFPVFEAQIDPSLYRSSDFSMDKKVKMLNTATEGNGIDIVLMGDAYSDRLIADGTYENDMVMAMDALFSHEPFKSHKHLFNVYLIYSVSINEVLGEDCCFDSSIKDVSLFENNTQFWNDYTTVRNYAMLASKKSDKYQVFPILVMNTDVYGGFATTNTEFGESDMFDYPARIEGQAVVARDRDGDSFHYVVCHEFGHSFAALYEEYVDRDNPMEEWEETGMKEAYTHIGWWSNVDFTSDPETIKWHRFLEDSRYDSSEVSIIEGARHAIGIWRSVDQSMMGTGGEYSIPAREAIYKKIHKLAYGEEWQYDYESFVLQDIKNLQNSAPSTAAYIPYPVRVDRKPFLKMEESISSDGKKAVTLIMN